MYTKAEDDEIEMMSYIEALESCHDSETSHIDSRIQASALPIDAVSRQNSKLGTFITVMKTALTMNMLTLLVFYSILPQQILNLIYMNCQAQLEGCNNYLRLSALANLLRVIVSFLHPLLVFMNMKKIHTLPN